MATEHLLEIGVHQGAVLHNRDTGHDGVASGYIHTTNINPTVGVRYKF